MSPNSYFPIEYLKYTLNYVWKRATNTQEATTPIFSPPTSFPTFETIPSQTSPWVVKARFLNEVNQKCRELGT